MDRSSCDVLVIGTGLGAAAIARRLTAVGASVVMLPGAGCARFKHLDGGVVSRLLLEKTIGDTSTAPLHNVGSHTVFQRDELETWALDQIGGSLRIVDDFEDAQALPLDSGSVEVRDVSGHKTIRAGSVVLTEGANPKIGIAARVREDFEPEDLIHFGRTKITGVSVAEPVTGAFRTSWNMPAWYLVIPQPDGALVSTAVRIENVMRSHRDGREVLADMLHSPLAVELGIEGEHGEIGMELVPLKSSGRSGMLGAHNVMITFDANGTIDARSIDRYNAILSSSTELGAMWVSEWPNLPEWDEMGVHIWNSFTSGRTPYHDDKESGFIEDGPGKSRGLLGRLFNR